MNVKAENHWKYQPDENTHCHEIVKGNLRRILKNPVNVLLESGLFLNQ